MYTIYELKFPDNRKYIGFTKQSLTERFDNGMGYMHSNGKASRSIVAKAIVYFGWKNIEKTTLATTDSLEEANKLEQKFIKEYRTAETSYGFNTQTGGKIGYVFNKDFIASVKGQRRSINTEFRVGHKCFTNHPFVCLENGKIYMNRLEAEKDLKIKLNHITEVCKGTRKHSGGYRFVYCEDHKKEKKQK